MKFGMRILKYLTCVFAGALLLGTVVSAASAPEQGAEELQYVDVSANVIKLGGLYETAEGGYVSARPKMLSPEEETANAIKETIATGLRNGDAAINIASYGLSPAQLYDYYTQVLNENPDFIYVRGYSYSYTLNGEETVVTVVRPKTSIMYTRENAEELMAKAQEIVDGMPASFTDEQKILYLHDYLVTHCQYDIPTLSLTQKQIQEQELGKFNAYNALIEGTAVCQGYSEAMVLLGKYAGLDIKIVTSENKNHAWNMIRLDNVYYFIDCTWDDPTGDWYPTFCRHVNLLRSSDGMAETSHRKYYQAILDTDTPETIAEKEAYNEANWVNEDWTCGGLGNVVDYCMESKKFDSWYWSTVKSAIPFLGDTCAYAKGDVFGKVYLRKADGTEQEVSVTDLSHWNVWNGGGYFWTENYASFTTFGNHFFFSTPTKIISLSKDGSFGTIYELDSSATGYIYGILEGAAGIDLWIGEAPTGSFTKNGIEVSLVDNNIRCTSMSVSLRDNLALTFKAKKDLFTEGYGVPYMVFNFNGREVTVQAKEVGTFYTFTYPNISPQQIGDDVTGTMYVMYGKYLIPCRTQTYSVQRYCDKALETEGVKNTLSTLIVDLLNYGAAAQEYTGYRMDALVNANVTATQQSFATDERAFNSVYGGSGEATMTDIKFKKVALVLSETVAIRYGFTAPNGVSGVTLKIEDEQGHSWTLGESSFVQDETDPTLYFVTFRKFEANRMSDRVLATLWKDGKHSKTLNYSIESYASGVKPNDTALFKLVKYMMKYGDAANAYKPSN